jgi:uncharacterized protein (TIGR03790 family)
MRRRGSMALATVLALSTLASVAGASLEPDQIALVVNSNVPAGRELAEFYAQKRNIPPGRIVALDLPFPAEEMPFERYDAAVVPAVRKFLNDNGLRDKVTCLVTFWGVPLRIGRRVPTPEEAKQLESLRQEAQKAQADLDAAVADAEALAREVTGTYLPGQGRDVQQLAKRAGDAMTAAMRVIATMPAGERRDAMFRRLVRLLGQVSGEPEVFDRLSNPDFAKLAPEPPTPQQLAESKRKALQWKQELDATQGKPPSAENFQSMRAIVREHFGLFRYLALLGAQQAVYDPKETESAFDSELALVWWDNKYSRTRWQANALSHKVRDVPAGTPPTVMVVRLDGPTAETVDRIILSSLKAEKLGLKGQAVLDARGLRGTDGYGKYDQTIRNLARLLESKTKLKVTFDDRDALIQPGPDAPKNVALYCGWYSLRNYVRASQFAEGAVGFHVASSELVSLRGENERGWVRGLLDDGVAGTLGPVAEPYLQSFPPADEFFPLLLTGKLTLAEVYWKTTPLTSWMNTCIGDPLYTPYKANPAIRVEDLPDRLQDAFRAAPAPGAPGPSTATPKK